MTPEERSRLLRLAALHNQEGDRLLAHAKRYKTTRGLSFAWEHHLHARNLLARASEEESCPHTST